MDEDSNEEEKKEETEEDKYLNQIVEKATQERESALQ